MKDKNLLLRRVGSRIRDFRKDSRLTLEKLSKLSGLNLSRSSISNIERGKQDISVYQLYALSNVLDVPVGSFFDAGNGSNISEQEQNIISNL